MAPGIRAIHHGWTACRLEEAIAAGRAEAVQAAVRTHALQQVVVTRAVETVATPRAIADIPAEAGPAARIVTDRPAVEVEAAAAEAEDLLIVGDSL